MLEKGLRPIFPAWFSELSFEEAKSKFTNRTLLGDLQNYFSASSCKEDLIELRLNQERCRRDNFSLSFILTFANPQKEVPYEKELISYYPVQGKPPFYSEARTWFFPDDPSIPHLSKIKPKHDLLHDVCWEKPLGKKHVALLEGEVMIERLLYHPGQRGSFLISPLHAGGKFLLKSIRPEDFKDGLNRVLSIQASALRQQITMPQVVSYSMKESYLLYAFLPGKGIDQLSTVEFEQKKSVLSEEISSTLSAIHGTEIPDLPKWNPENEMDKTARFLDHLKDLYPVISKEMTAIFSQISACLKGSDSTHYRVIHNDFSARHIISHRGEREKAPINFAYIDWDDAAIGPPEKDIARFLYDVQRLYVHQEKPDPSFSKTFINQYEVKRKITIDRYLVNVFIQFFRFLGVIKKIFRHANVSKKHEKIIKSIYRQLK